jgi:hypothetical protein
MSAGLQVLRIESVDLRIRDWLDSGSSPGSGSGKYRYRAVYDRLTGVGVFGAAQAAANLILRATGLGDQLLMLARKPGTPGGIAL